MGGLRSPPALFRHMRAGTVGHGNPLLIARPPRQEAIPVFERWNSVGDPTAATALVVLCIGIYLAAVLVFAAN